MKTNIWVRCITPIGNIVHLKLPSALNSPDYRFLSRNMEKYVLKSVASLITEIAHYQFFDDGTLSDIYLNLILLVKHFGEEYLEYALFSFWNRFFRENLDTILDYDTFPKNVRLPKRQSLKTDGKLPSFW